MLTNGHDVRSRPLRDVELADGQPTAPHVDLTSISSKLMPGWSLEVRLFRNDATCGLIT